MSRDRIIRTCTLLVIVGIIAAQAAWLGALRGMASRGELPSLHLRGALE